MSVNFFTPLRFSQQCLGEIAQAGKSTLLEKLSGRLDEVFIQSSKGVEIKALGPDKGGLLYERVKGVNTAASLCLKVFIALLIVPVIIALILKIIVRLCLYLKYSGKAQEIIVSTPSTTSAVGSMNLVDKTTKIQGRTLTREEIVDKFLTLPKLSDKNRNLLIESTKLIVSRSCKSLKEYKKKGILFKLMPKENEYAITFELEKIPGLYFTYYSGSSGFVKADEECKKDVVSSSKRTISKFQDLLGITIDFLTSVPVTTNSTQEEVDALIKDGLRRDVRLGIFNVEVFDINKSESSPGESIGILIRKNLD
ncbi:adherence factor [Chlamydia sp. 12-01]|uniref:adherence factor n=1 Tax=Chlamydia sp. 12-01 TaxID=3002742 RepID=UPI0035D4B909